jgi:hypothetical protein
MLRLGAAAILHVPRHPRNLHPMTAPRLVVLRGSRLYCFHRAIFTSTPVSRAVMTHTQGSDAQRGAPTIRSRTPGRSDAAGRCYTAGHSSTASEQASDNERCRLVAVFRSSYSSTPTCARFESVRCHTFITESTFALADLPLWSQSQGGTGRPQPTEFQ